MSLLLLTVLALLVVLARAASAPSSYDTGLYHAQSIRWIEEYGAVPGLANLHTRLGYASTWFAGQALFGARRLLARPVHALDAATAALFVLHCVGVIARRARDRPSPAAGMAMVLLPLGAWLFREEVGSPGLDLPAAIFVWVAVLLHVSASSRTRAPIAPETLACFLLATFAGTIKLSAMPIALLALLVLGNALRRGGVRLGCALAAAAIVLLVPLVLRSLVVSGHLLFPIVALDLAGRDWAVPRPVAWNDLRWIRSWAIQPGANVDQVLSLPAREWVWPWLVRQRLHARVWIAVVAGTSVAWLTAQLLAPLVPAMRSFAARSRARATLAPLAVAVVGVAVWLVAPDPRHGWPFLALLPLLLAAPLLESIARRMPVRAWAAAVAVWLIVWCAPQPLSLGPDALGMPRRYPIPAVASHHLGDLEVLVPERGDQCWYAPFPCTPHLAPGLRLRGSGWSAGFAVTPPRSSIDGAARVP